MSNYTLLIDGDNVNATYLKPLQEYITNVLGENITNIYLFGKLRSSYLCDWKRAFPSDTTQGVIKYDISENSKNSADVRMLCVALQLYYNEGIRKFIIMSSDSDMESLVKGLADDAEVIVAYSSQKTSKKYLKRLHQQGVECIDLDGLRGPLDSANQDEILNQMMQSYIQFKLSNKYFSYGAVIDWIMDRYPELVELQEMRDANPYQFFRNIKLSFTPDGVQVETLEG